MHYPFIVQIELRGVWESHPHYQENDYTSTSALGEKIHTQPPYGGVHEKAPHVTQ